MQVIIYKFNESECIFGPLNKLQVDTTKPIVYNIVKIRACSGANRSFNFG